MKIRTLIVDDEVLARRNIAILLGRDPEIDIVGECSSGKEAIQAARTIAPDLMFLDVQMPDCDGFDVLTSLGGAWPAAVIFVTAYDRYALKAFEVEALDYLLKPFDDARFYRSLARAKEQIRRRSSGAPAAHRLIVKSAGRVSFIGASEIDWIEAADYYACLHVGGKTHLVRKSLANLERELDPSAFCRVHRSAIVNLKRVSELRVNENGDYQVVLKDGSELRLSRRYRKSLEARLAPA